MATPCGWKTRVCFFSCYVSILHRNLRTNFELFTTEWPLPVGWQPRVTNRKWWHVVTTSCSPFLTGVLYLFIFFISCTMATSCWVENTCLFLFLLVLPFSAGFISFETFPTEKDPRGNDAVEINLIFSHSYFFSPAGLISLSKLLYIYIARGMAATVCSSRSLRYGLYCLFLKKPEVWPPLFVPQEARGMASTVCSSRSLRYGLYC